MELVPAQRALQRRWPQLAALGGPLGVLGLLMGRRRLDRELALLLAGVPVLMLHQIEEWVWPDGFMAWMNREVLRSSSDTGPLTAARACAVNVYGGWGMSALAIAGRRRAPALVAALAGSHLANAALHLGYALRRGRWNPGAITAALLLAPWSALVLARQTRSGQLRPRAALTAGALGATTLPALIGRMRRESAAAARRGRRRRRLAR
ncbi:MAG TPA: HXXEE domain-containing protein [Solirubrobacteraceae bacterium]|nr:HXXEE domain-containing protein [Solirubrobacteraceae bacterium]